MTVKTPTNRREATAWARRSLARGLRPRITTALTTLAGRPRRRRTICRHERDARNVARGYLDDTFLDAFPEIVQDGDWAHTAAQMVSYANDYFAQIGDDPEMFEFYTCDICPH